MDAFSTLTNAAREFIAAAMERVRQKREAAAAAAPPTQETDPS